jgi:hypothetical protein
MRCGKDDTISMKPDCIPAIVIHCDHINAITNRYYVSRSKAKPDLRFAFIVQVGNKVTIPFRPRN